MTCNREELQQMKCPEPAVAVIQHASEDTRVYVCKQHAWAYQGNPDWPHVSTLPADLSPIQCTHRSAE